MDLKILFIINECTQYNLNIKLLMYILYDESELMISD